jgi:glycosyltransferase involved in cell wall biosynthesis
MQEKNQINILFAEDYLGSYPSLINALSILNNNKIKSNLIGFFFESSFPDYPEFTNVNYRLISRRDKICRIYEIKEQKKILLVTYIEKIIIKLKINLYFIIKYNLISIRKSFEKIKEILWILYLIRRNDSVIKDSPLICIDSITLISAYIYKIAFKKKFKIIFWSLEISTFSKIDLLDRLFEKIELHALKNVISVISQSPERLALISNIQKICKDGIDFFYIPHSRLEINKVERKSHFNTALKIRKETTILLHLGWIHDVTDSYNLAKSTLDWKEDIQLIFHERAKRKKYDPYIKKITELNSKTLHLSLCPVPYEKLGDLIASCDIGLVVYKPENYGSSWSNIAKASGKLADSLAFGKPVICSNLPDLREIIETYECGFVFNKTSEIPSLIDKINKHYNLYSANALKCFSQEFEFSKFFNPFLHRIIQSEIN